MPLDKPTVQFDNHTQEAGLLVYSETFSAVVTDIDRDQVDDIFVGHHGRPPMLYLNQNGKFIAASDALPINERDDRHAYTFVDLDNDGDRDFVYAGGGADGLGKGSANRVYKNLLVETGKLGFLDVSENSDIGYPTWRSRAFHPLPSAAGDKVDLYLTSLHKRRKGSTNLFAINNSTPSNIRLEVDKTSSLHQPFESDGKDLFFDFDRDGYVDFLRLGLLRARLYRNHEGNFGHVPSVLNSLDRVISAVPADLNNDGYPDLYFGAVSGHSDSDNIASNNEEIHFAIQDHADGEPEIDEIAFKTRGWTIEFNFVEWIPSLGKSRTDATDIRIGQSLKNPPRRKGRIGKKYAAGKPENFEHPGTYIWFDPQNSLWHVRWKHKGEPGAKTKGIIHGKGIELVHEDHLEVNAPREVKDYVLLNQRGRGWKVLNLDYLEHTELTNYLTAADFNNDGFVDIVGVRARDDSNENGNPFILLNHGGLKFSREEILINEEDDIFRADLIVHGFFNDDGLPDLFFTNGFGLLPSYMGPYQYWLNSTDTDNGYLLLELEGTQANRDAIGAQVELYGKEDQLLGYRELGHAYGRGQDTHKLHFGLGQNKGPFRLRIFWPGQTTAQDIQLKQSGFYHILQSAKK